MAEAAAPGRPRRQVVGLILALVLLGLIVVGDQIVAAGLRRQLSAVAAQALSQAGLEPVEVSAQGPKSGLWALLTHRLDDLRLDVRATWPDGGGELTAQLWAQDVRWSADRVSLARAEATATLPGDALAQLAGRLLAGRPEVSWLPLEGLSCGLDPGLGQIELTAGLGLTARIEPVVQAGGLVWRLVGVELFGLSLASPTTDYALDLPLADWGARLVDVAVTDAGLVLDLVAENVELP
ncbi:MAG: hypothetical protein LBL55_11675 [Propionibacteriaceae bacterium]|nr:hypothetical protein [Propionibacteriaceae bacterium]